MRPFLQKLPLNRDSSIVARYFETPEYETPWHQHEEIELVLCKQSNGTAFIGNYIGDYKPGDVYLLGSELPHFFKKKDDDMIGSAIVVQFTSKIFGDMWNLPEFTGIKELLITSRKGLKLHGKLRDRIEEQLEKVGSQSGYELLRTVFDCLHLINKDRSYEPLTQYYFKHGSEENLERIALVYDYSLEHFQENITLQQMADLTNQSISNFCKYFKLNTKKTYVNFLNEIRIGHASKLLKTTDKQIAEICFESGFRNWSNFSSQFKRVRGMSPSAYRNSFAA